MKKYYIFAILCTLLVACGNKDSKDIENEMSSGVVLVQNQSYFEVILPSGESLYFTNYDNEEGCEGLTDDKDSLQQVLSYGTGFFISDKGQIATNMHVVNRSLDNEELKTIKDNLTSFFDALKEYLEDERKESSERYGEFKDAQIIASYDEDVSEEDLDEITENVDQLKDEINEYDEIIRNIDHIRIDDIEIKCHNKISIAYNDTHVTETEDFIPCVITKEDKEHDLAIIELKDKKTPQDKHIFKVPEKDPLEEYDFWDNLTKLVSDDKNSQLHMTSFNYGPLLAITEIGVKSQFNIGTISQTTTDKIMYSIPTLSGSSGSPVVNRCGELVAINFAGLLDTQNFNYGIKVKHLKNLMEQ